MNLVGIDTASAGGGIDLLAREVEARPAGASALVGVADGGLRRGKHGSEGQEGGHGELHLVVFCFEGSDGKKK